MTKEIFDKIANEFQTCIEIYIEDLVVDFWNEYGLDIWKEYFPNSEQPKSEEETREFFSAIKKGCDCIVDNLCDNYIYDMKNEVSEND